MKPVTIAVSVPIVLFCASGCGGSDSPTAAGGDYNYQVPVQRSDGWEVGSVEEAGLDAGRLNDMMADIHRDDFDSSLRNILIVKNNKLVFEEYFPTSGIDNLSHMQSATKSIVSAIFGIARADGYVDSVDDPLFDFMTPGFDWNEHTAPTFGEENDDIAAYRSQNYIRYLLEKDVVTTPGYPGYPLELQQRMPDAAGRRREEPGRRASGSVRR